MNDFRKKVPPERKLSAREAVTLYGDSWRLLGNTTYNWIDTMTHDALEYYTILRMERGQEGRVRTWDCR